MNEKIKAKAQALYPPEEKASEYVAFLRGAEFPQMMNFLINKIGIKQQ